MKFDKLQSHISATDTKSQTFLQILVENNGSMTTAELREASEVRSDLFLQADESLETSDINYRAKSKFSATPELNIDSLPLVTRETVEGRKSKLIILNEDWTSAVEKYLESLQKNTGTEVSTAEDLTHLIDKMNDIESKVNSLEDRVDKTYEITQGLAENNGKHDQQIDDLSEEVDNAHERIEKMKEILVEEIN